MKMTAQTIAQIEAQIAALREQERAIKAAERSAQHEQEKEDRKIFREFDRAMRKEFLARDKDEAKTARAAARAQKAERVAQLRLIIETAGFTVAEIRAAIREEETA